MCTNPINIKNVNYHNRGLTLSDPVVGSYLHYSGTDESLLRKKAAAFARLSRSTMPLYRWVKDSSFSRSLVPCGTCDECLRLKQLQLLQRCQVEFDSCYVIFVTLTYKPKYLPELITSQDRSVSFSDPSDIRRMLKSIRHYGGLPPFKQLFVSEFGGKRHRPHWHGLFFFPKCSIDRLMSPEQLEKRMIELIKRYWVVCTKPGRFPEFDTLCDFNSKRYRNGKVERPWDCHLVTEFISNERTSDLFSSVDVSSDKSSVMFYVSKYMLKPDDWIRKRQQALRLNYDPDEYKAVWSQVRPRVMISQFFGVTEDAFSIVEDMLNRSLKPQIKRSYPQFLLRGVKDGVSHPVWTPMCRYYRNLRPRDMSITDKVRPLRSGGYIFSTDMRRFYFASRPSDMVVEPDSGSFFRPYLSAEECRSRNARVARRNATIVAHNGDYTFDD